MKNKDKAKKAHGREVTTEDKLRITEAKFKGLFDNVSSGVAIYQARNDGEDFVFVDLNATAERIEKVKKEHIVGKSVADVFPGVKDFGLFEVFRRVWKTGQSEHHPVSLYKDERVVGWRENHVLKLPSGEIVAVYDDVTERKQSEHLARMSEQCFRAIADYTYFWETWVSPSGRLLWTNPAAYRLTGYTTKELVAMPDYPMPLIHEGDRGRMGRAFKRALSGAKGNEVEFRLCRKDGSVIWADVSWQAIYNDEGTSQGYRASVRDITQRKDAEEALRLAQFSLDNAADAVFWMGPDARFVYVNPAACRVLGYSRDELLSMTVHDMDPDFPKKVWREHWEQVRQRGFFTLESHHRAKDGRVFPVEVSVNYIKFGGKEYNCAFARDISQRKQAEEALQRANRALKVLSECNQVLVRATEEQDLLNQICRIIVEIGKYRMAWVGFGEPDENRTIRPVARSGHEQGYLDCIELTWAETGESQDPAGFAIRGRNYLIDRSIITGAEGKPWRVEAGKRGYASCIALPLVVEAKVLGSLSIYAGEEEAFDKEEVTLLEELANDLALGIEALRARAERRQAIDKLRESEEGFRLLVENVKDYAIFMLDPKGYVVSWNAGAEHIKGYSADEIIGRHFNCFYTNEDVERGTPERALRTAEVEGCFQDEELRVRKDGTRFWASVVMTALRDEEGQLRGFSKVVRDITERKNAYERIRRQGLLLDAVNRVFREALFCEDEEQVAQTCLAVAEEITSSKFGFISEVDPAGHLNTIAISDPGWEACRIPKTSAVKMLKDLEVRGIRGRVIKDGQSMIFNEPASHTDFISPPEGHPKITSFLGVPLKRAGKTVGIIGLGNKEGGYEQAEIEDIETLSAAFKEALDRKRAERKLLEHQNKLKSLTSELVQTEERERQHVGAALHDNICQKLAFAKLTLQSASESVSDTKVRGSLDKACGAIGQVIEDTRSLTFELSNPVLHELGLEAAVERHLTQEIEQKHGIKFEFEGDKKPSRLDKNISTCLFRNVRELLTNVVKHAEARRVKVSIHQSNGQIQICVEDDGKGFNAAEVVSMPDKTSGFGLFSIREQMEMLGGHLEIESEPGHGSKLTVIAPTKQTTAVGK